MLDRLKRVNLDAVSLEEAIELAFLARGLRAEFDARQCEVPEWLDTRSRELTRFIEVSRQDHLDKRLRTARAQLASLETVGEKRDRIQAEIAELQAMLDGAAKPAPAGQ